MSKPVYLLLPNKESPLVYLDFALKLGSVADPDGKEGLASITLSMLLRGTKQHAAKEFHEALDLLGAEIHLGKHKESLRVYGVTLKENLKPFLKLFRSVITEPRFDAEEFRKLKEQFKSALLDELSSDDDIADRRFQEHLLWGHPYGKMVSGNLQSIDSIKLEDVKQFYAEHFVAGGAVFSALGSFDKAMLKKELEQIAKKLSSAPFKRINVTAPDWPVGKNILLLHKPGRTQSQIIIGARGIAFQDKDYTSIQVANHVFGGGSFSARLMKEVREKRGWSYGAYASYRASRKPLCMSLQTVPATKDTVPALVLMLDLFAKYQKSGLTKDEFKFAKTSLVNQAAFLTDSLRKRLDNKVTEILLDLPKGFYADYLDRLGQTTLPRVQKAISKNIDAKNVFVVILGDADVLEPQLKKIKGWKRFVRKNFDDLPSSIW
jgi:zinc protease